MGPSDVESGLAVSCASLRSLIEHDGDAIAPAGLQRTVESQVAAAVRALLDVPVPAPAASLPLRPMLARDLLVSADLAKRSLSQHLLKAD